MHFDIFKSIVFCSEHSYTPQTVHGVQVMEGKATEQNFMLSPVVSDSAGSITVPTSSTPSTPSSPNIITTTTSSTYTTHAQVDLSGDDANRPSVPPPAHQAIQPQKFRHHNYADMELFLRKYRSEFPSITHLYSIGHSLEGRELFVMVISDNPTVHEHGKSVG